MKTNSGINCSVTSCKHNVDACQCCLEEVQIACTCGEACTCCDSYKES